MSIKHISFDDSATVAFGSITNAYVNLLALSDDTDILFIFNTTDVDVVLNIPNALSKLKPPTVLTSNIRIPTSSTMTIDCRSNSKRIAKGTIQIKYASGAPTSGEVVVTAAR